MTLFVILSSRIKIHEFHEQARHEPNYFDDCDEAEADTEAEEAADVRDKLYPSLPQITLELEYGRTAEKDLK